MFMTYGNKGETWIDIVERLDEKSEALKENRSELGDGEWIDKEMREWAHGDAKEPGIEYSESFRRMVFWDDKAAQQLDQKTGEAVDVPPVAQEHEKMEASV